MKPEGAKQLAEDFDNLLCITPNYAGMIRREITNEFDVATKSDQIVNDVRKLIEREIAQRSVTDSEIQEAINDTMLMIHENEQQMSRISYSPFADSDDLELLRIHIDTLHLALRSIRAHKREPCEWCDPNGKLYLLVTYATTDKGLVEYAKQHEKPKYCCQCGRKLQEEQA